jgi:hypothetical protein
MRARLSALWVRNVIGIVVVATAIAVLFMTGMAESWSEYRHTVVPEVVVAKGQSGNADGRTWKVDSVRHLNRSPSTYGPSLPTGTVLTVVTLDRSGPLYTDQICNGVITDGERRWKSEGIGGFQPAQAEGVTTLCSQPGRLQFTFLLPQDTVPTALDVVRFDGRIIVRLLL